MHFKLKPLSNTHYYGGKGSSGTYQKIINEIPPHYYFVSGFLGHCSILRNKKPSPVSYGFELNKEVIDRWEYDERLFIFNCCFLKSARHLNMMTRGKTFIYLDPPYPLSSRKSDTLVYDYELTDDYHVKLLNYLLKLRCDIAISTYPNDLYAEYLKDWRCISFQSNTRHGLATELLYMNYPKPDKIHDYSFLGNDYREREAIKNKHRSLTSKISMLDTLQRNKLFEELKATYKL